MRDTIATSDVRRFVTISVMALLAESAMAFGQSTVGVWHEDEQGLPSYEYTGRLPYSAKDKKGQPVLLPNDPFFLLGSYRLTLFTHVSGIYQLMTGERVWARMNASGRTYGENGATLTIDRDGRQEKVDLVGLDSIAADPARCRRVFGTGYARYDYTPAPDLRCSRILSIKPASNPRNGVPAFVVTVRLSNLGKEPITLNYSEWVLANYAPVPDSTKAFQGRMVTYRNNVHIDAARSLIRSEIAAVSKDPTLFGSRDQASAWDGYPPSLYMHVPASGGISPQLEAVPSAPGKDRLSTRVSLRLDPGKTKDFDIVIGISFEAGVEDIAAQCQSLAGSRRSPDGALFREEWRRKLPDLSQEADPVLRREMLWNAYTLEAMATYSRFYDETFVPQGMTYDYDMDLTAAPRDHLQHTLALDYFDPELARSSLRYVLKKMTSQGELKYTDYAYGKTSNSAWNTSDQQLYLFLALGEYLRITGDSDFLLTETNFLPMEAKYKGTTIEKIERAFDYLRDEVSVGPHGLIRLMNSDWNDAVFLETPVMQHFFTAESHMNTTMALVIIPNLVAQLRKAALKPGFPAAQRARIEALIEGMTLYDTRLREAFYRDLGDRTYSRRMYLGGGVSPHDEVMQLEPQSFLMQMSDFPVERKTRLWAEIQRRLMNNEALGPRQREKAVAGVFGLGIRENGGFWYALAGPLVLGVASFDKPAAEGLLRQMTFDNFTRHFPDYWIGQWTGPDTLNSSLAGEYEGLPTPDRTWTPFAAFCAHVHAWPLYDYYRLKE